MKGKFLFYVLMFADILTTYIIIFDLNGVEANPIMRMFMGFGWGAFVFVKIILTTVVVRVFNRRILRFCNIGMVLVVAVNVQSIMRYIG